MDIFSCLLPSSLKIHVDPFKSKRPYPLKHVLRILLVYLLFWLLYLISWVMIGKVFPAIQLNFILIASTYTISWIVGFLSVFTPSGLGIREASFVYISSVMGAGHLAFLAVFIRIWLTMIDVILAVFSLAIERRMRWFDLANKSHSLFCFLCASFCIFCLPYDTSFSSCPLDEKWQSTLTLGSLGYLLVCHLSQRRNNAYSRDWWW